ncbi:C6 transcription factor [Apiospora arundinis]
MADNGRQRHKACSTCRERKIKCDSGQPKCGGCAHRGHECFYPPTSRRYNKADFAMMLETMNQRVLQAEAAAQNPVYSLGDSSSSLFDTAWTPFDGNTYASCPSFADAGFVFPSTQTSAEVPPSDELAMPDMALCATGATTGISMIPHTSESDIDSIMMPDITLGFSTTLSGPEPANSLSHEAFSCIEGADNQIAAHPHRPNDASFKDASASAASKRRRLEEHPDNTQDSHEATSENSPAETPRVFSPCDSAMRRTIGNGASFRDIPKLRGADNYEEWMRTIRAAARKEGVWDMMVGICHMPPAPVPGAALAAHKKYNDDLTYWQNKQDLALGGIEGALTETAQVLVDGAECAHAMWTKLEQEFKPSHHNETLYSTMQRLENLSLATQGTVHRLADELRLLQKSLASLIKVQELPGWYFSIRFLLSLGPEYNGFILNIMAPGSDPIDIASDDGFERLIALAITEEKRLS